jgi:esterase/lipase superfamily enzyme
VGAFGNLTTMLRQIQSELQVQINVICHSEGNYMIMLALSAEALGEPPVFNQVLLAAADINNGALQLLGSPPDAGQGLPISNLSRREI